MFIFTFVAIFAATIFLAWQCFHRMTGSLTRSMLVQFFQRTSRSLPRPLWMVLWNQGAVLSDASTQTDGPDQTIRLLNCRIDMFQQQVHERDERLEDLESLVHYYEGQVTTTSLFVSRAGIRYHLSQDCRALQQANQSGIRDLRCCSQCIQVFHDNSNLGGPWWFFSLFYRCEFVPQTTPLANRRVRSTTCCSRTPHCRPCRPILAFPAWHPSITYRGPFLSLAICYAL